MWNINSLTTYNLNLQQLLNWSLLKELQEVQVQAQPHLRSHKPTYTIWTGAQLYNRTYDILKQMLQLISIKSQKCWHLLKIYGNSLRFCLETVNPEGLKISLCSSWMCGILLYAFPFNVFNKIGTWHQIGRNIRPQRTIKFSVPKNVMCCGHWILFCRSGCTIFLEECLHFILVT